MERQKVTVDKEELRQFSELLSEFQKLPQMERVAIQYYVKGRIDAIVGNIEIPIENTRAAS